MANSWTPNHTKLYDTLAQLFLDRADSERIAVQAGLNPASIKFKDSAIDTWFEIIKEADRQDVLVELIQQALGEFRTNSVLLDSLKFFETRATVEPGTQNATPSKKRGRSKPKKKVSTGLSIGDNAHIYGNINTGDLTGDMNYRLNITRGAAPAASPYPLLRGQELVEVEGLFVNLRSELEKPGLTESTRALGAEYVNQLNQEITKSNGPPEGVVILLAGKWLLTNIPAMHESMASLFHHPGVNKVVEGAGQAVGNWVQENFSPVQKGD